MFKVIEHQQNLFVLQVIQQLFNRLCRPAKPQIKRRCDFNRNCFNQVIVVRVEVCQFNQPDAILVVVEAATSNCGSQAGLTHTTWPYDCDKPAPGLVEPVMKFLLGECTPKKLIVDCGQIMTNGRMRA